MHLGRVLIVLGGRGDGEYEEILGVPLNLDNLPVALGIMEKKMETTIGFGAPRA